MVLPEQRLLLRLEFSSVMYPGQVGRFFVGQISAEEIAVIRLGDKGQYRQMMPLAEFMGHMAAVLFMQDRLRAVLDEGVTDGP